MQFVFVVDIVICVFGMMIWKVGLQVVFWCVDVEYLVELVWCVFVVGVYYFLLVSVLGVDVYFCVFYNCCKGEVEVEILLIGFLFVMVVWLLLLFGVCVEFWFGECVV